MNRLILVLTWILASNGNLFGQTGQILSLDGDGGFVEVPDSTILNIGGTAEFTVEFWFRTGDRLTANLINKCTLQTPSDGGFWQGTGWAVDINRSATGLISFQAKAGGVGGATSRCCINPNQWHHFAYTMSRDSLGPHSYSIPRRMYIDGVPLSSGRSISVDRRDFSTIGTSLGIGNVPSNIVNSRYFRGEIDEVRLWNVARTQSQIQATMSDILGSPYYATADSGLIAYYRFDRLENLGIGDDGLADDVRDLSVHGNQEI